jgi:hypothetical protein
VQHVNVDDIHNHLVRVRRVVRCVTS